MIGQGSVSDQLTIDQRSISDRLATISEGYAYGQRKFYDCLKTGLVSTHLAKAWGLKTVEELSVTPTTVGDKSPTSTSPDYKHDLFGPPQLEYALLYQLTVYQDIYRS